MENRETRRKTRRRGVVWKTVAGIVVGLAVCNLAVAFREVGRHKDKIWLHRCNSMEKLYEKEHRYPNVEVDLVFREDNTFDVTHDVGVSFGQQLDDYFAHMGETGGRMWLDIKNLNPDNAERMLDALDTLAESYGMDKERLIVESPDWESLGLFTREGFYTSCYVTLDLPRRVEPEEEERGIEALRRVADSGNVCALSFPGPWYSTLKEELDRPIDLLTWRHRTTQLEFFLLPMGRKMVNDPQLKVILVKDKGKYHR